jgi:hypothetical protein
LVGLADEAHLIEQLESFQHALGIPGGSSEPETDVDALPACREIPSPARGSNPRFQSGFYGSFDDGRPPGTPVFPGKATVTVQPTCFTGTSEALFVKKGQISYRYDPRTAHAFAGVAKPITESVELFDVAQMETGLLFHPAPQAELQRPIMSRIECPEGKRHEPAGFRVGFFGKFYREYSRYLVRYGNDNRVQPDEHVRFTGSRLVSSCVSRAHDVFSTRIPPTVPERLGAFHSSRASSR